MATHEGAQRPGGLTPRQTVLVLDDNADIRTLLCEFIIGPCQRRCLAVASYRDLVELGQQALDCELAILDVNLGPGQPSGVDAYDWLLEHGFHGRVAFITGHARTHPAVARAMDLRAAAVYQKPISPDFIRSLVAGAP